MVLIPDILYLLKTNLTIKLFQILTLRGDGKINLNLQKKVSLVLKK